MNPFKEEKSATIAKSNSKVFESFFFDYYPRIKGFINGFLQNEEEAEDLSQDIFLSLWKNRMSLYRIEHFNAYLFTIARNAVYRHLERSLLLKDYQQHQASDILYGQPFSSNETEENIYVHELELLVALAVERMPPQRQKIYRMSREQGLKNEEIAERLHISKRTVENHLTQALADIRNLLLLAICFFF